MLIADERRLIARYVSGANVRELAKDLGITPQTIYNILKRNNVQKRTFNACSKKEKLLEACLGGAVASLTAKQMGLSESTATRVVHKFRESGGTIQIKKGRPGAARARVFSSFGTSPILDEKHANLSLIPFPYPIISAEQFEYELVRIRKFVSRLDGKEIRPRSPVGIKLCAPFFPNRFRAQSKSMLSAFAAWQDKKTLQKAIEFQISRGNPVTPKRVLRAVTLICRTPSIFRPAVAKFICETYCPKGGIVWDPCSGYGGRLLGATAADIRYIGTDVDEATIAGNRELARAIGAKAILHLCPAEDFIPPAVDLVFTSPPYFNRERYSQEICQSYRRHGVDLETWMSDFLQPVMERAYVALSVSGHLILNIADIKENSKTLPLVAQTIDLAIKVGFRHKDTLLMPLSAINRIAPKEPILIFQK